MKYDDPDVDLYRLTIPIVNQLAEAFPGVNRPLLHEHLHWYLCTLADLLLTEEVLAISGALRNDVTAQVTVRYI